MCGFYIEVPAEYPECHIVRTLHGIPESDGDEERLIECSTFAADRIEHSFARRICGDGDPMLQEINEYAFNMGVECRYDPYGGPDGRGAILLGVK